MHFVDFSATTNDFHENANFFITFDRLNENYFHSLQSHSDGNFHIFCDRSERAKKTRKKELQLKPAKFGDG